MIVIWYMIRQLKCDMVRINTQETKDKKQLHFIQRPKQSKTYYI